ncbi:hypothetical protein BD413DRAFT_540101, partial [Trametes elegans]
MLPSQQHASYKIDREHGVAPAISNSLGSRQSSTCHQMELPRHGRRWFPCITPPRWRNLHNIHICPRNLLRQSEEYFRFPLDCPVTAYPSCLPNVAIMRHTSSESSKADRKKAQTKTPKSVLRAMGPKKVEHTHLRLQLRAHSDMTSLGGAVHRLLRV